tara:strand:- start:980 stop:1183 length:204 start_codon:yes stop_codon:yes gene_type:complete
MKEKLPIYTKHYSHSVVEVYLSEDNSRVSQIKCLTRNRCKKYVYDTRDYIEKEMVGYKEIEKKLISQ